MRHQSGFNFRSTHAMAGNIDDIVDAAGDPVIAIGIAATAVTGKIVAGYVEIRIDKALVITIHGPHLAGPAIGDAQIARRSPSSMIAVLSTKAG